MDDLTLRNLAEDHAFRLPLRRHEFYDIYRLDADAIGRTAYARYMQLRTYYRALRTGQIETPGQAAAAQAQARLRPDPS